MPIERDNGGFSRDHSGLGIALIPIRELGTSGSPKDRVSAWSQTRTLPQQTLLARYWVHTILDHIQWATPFNMDDFKRKELDRQARDSA